MFTITRLQGLLEILRESITEGEHEPEPEALSAVDRATALYCECKRRSGQRLMPPRPPL